MANTAAVAGAIVIPIFLRKVESFGSIALFYPGLGARLRIFTMDQEALMISLFFTFMLGAGIGFLLARIIL